MGGQRIQVEADTWIVMREYPQFPKAVIQGFRGTDGAARFMVLTWDPIRTRRRMVSIHESLDEADAAVPWPTPVNTATYHAQQRGNASGYPPGTSQYDAADRRIEERRKQEARQGGSAPDRPRAGA